LGWVGFGCAGGWPQPQQGNAQGKGGCGARRTRATLTVADTVDNADAAPLTLAEDDPLPVVEPEGEGAPDEDVEIEAEAELVAEGLPVVEGRRVTLDKDDTVTVPLGETLTVAECVVDEEIVPDTLAAALGETVPLVLSEAEGEDDAEVEAEGAAEKVALGDICAAQLKGCAREDEQVQLAGHGVQATEPAIGEYEPGGQRTQGAPPAPKKPKGHKVHDTAPGAGPAPKPGGQAAHATVAATAVDTLPAGHTVQETAPGALE